MRYIDIKFYALVKRPAEYVHVATTHSIIHN